MLTSKTYPRYPVGTLDTDDHTKVHSNVHLYNHHLSIYLHTYPHTHHIVCGKKNSKSMHYACRGLKKKQILYFYKYQVQYAISMCSTVSLQDTMPYRTRTVWDGGATSSKNIRPLKFVVPTVR